MSLGSRNATRTTVIYHSKARPSSHFFQKNPFTFGCCQMHTVRRTRTVRIGRQRIWQRISCLLVTLRGPPVVKRFSEARMHSSLKQDKLFCAKSFEFFLFVLWEKVFFTGCSRCKIKVSGMAVHKSKQWVFLLRGDFQHLQETAQRITHWRQLCIVGPHDKSKHFSPGFVLYMSLPYTHPVLLFQPSCLQG